MRVFEPSLSHSLTANLEPSVEAIFRICNRGESITAGAFTPVAGFIQSARAC